MLDVLDNPINDNSITRYEYHAYQLFSQSTLDNLDEIRIIIQQVDLYTYPCEIYLYIKGYANFSESESVKSINLTNNFPFFLFAEIRLELNNIVIYQTKNFGVTAALKNTFFGYY